MNCRRRSSLLTGLGFGLALTGSARADDIDMYLQVAGAAGSPARIVLAVPGLPQVGEPLCADADASGCSDRLGAAVHRWLDLVGEGGAPGPDGLADADQAVAAGVPLPVFRGVRAVLSADAARAAFALSLDRLGRRVTAAGVDLEVALIAGQEEPQVAVPFQPIGTAEERYRLSAALAAAPALIADPLSGQLPPYPLQAVYDALEQYLLAPGGGDGPVVFPASGAVCAQLRLVNWVWEPPAETLSVPGSLPVPVASFFFAPAPDAQLHRLARQGGTAKALVIAEPDQLLHALETVFRLQWLAGGVAGDLSLMADRQDLSQWLNQAFLPMYEPGTGPRWAGNVKKYRLLAGQTRGDGGHLRDVYDNPALSLDDDQIRPEALSFWTDPDGSDLASDDPVARAVSGRDGAAVRRGGAGQRIPGFLAGPPPLINSEPGARRLFTEDPRNPGELLALDIPAAAALLAPYLDPEDRLTPDQIERLLAWIRGRDSFDEDRDGVQDEVRPWLMGAVIHSRPLAVNYGAREGSGRDAARPDMRLFFGAGDGFLRGVVNTDSLGRESGTESFAFLPLELLGAQWRLARNRPGEVPGPHYGLDGEPLAWIEDLDQDGNIEPSRGDRVTLFIGQRRGGSTLYAVDVSDPDRPVLSWKIRADSPGFEQLGLGFSTPRLVRLDRGAGNASMALVFGGGYHGGWSGSGRVGKDAGGGPDPVGNAVYVVDARTGTLIWKAVGPSAGDGSRGDWDTYLEPRLLDSIPSPVTTVDGDGNGYVDHAYVGDTGGRLWRVALTESSALEQPGGPPEGSWGLSLIADFGGEGADDRRFFHPPDYVAARDESGTYGGVLVASGNRAAPLGDGVSNFLYLVKDRTPPNGRSGEPPLVVPLKQEDLPDVTRPCGAPETDACPLPNLVAGWRLGLEARGEKAWSAVVTAGGVATLNSYVPPFPDQAASACTAPLGRGRSYLVYLRDGRSATALARRVNPPDIGLPYLETTLGPPTAILPTRRELLLPGGGANGELSIELPGRATWRESWRETGVDHP